MIALFGELSLEEAMDLSQDGLLLELDVFFLLLFRVCTEAEEIRQVGSTRAKFVSRNRPENSPYCPSV
jgi:hypothetical protein